MEDSGKHAKPIRDGLLKPAVGTVQGWAWNFIRTTQLADKLRPDTPPATWEDDVVPRRLSHPGRPAELRVLSKSRKFPGAGALRQPVGRTRIMHTFAHHELQAAELMCWAILAFPSTPRNFQRGLLAIAREEIRHMNLYCDYLEHHGVSFGDEPVRDWFWSRVPLAQSASEFVAVMGMGLEGGNLDHSERFAAWFREVGDHEAAEILDVVGSEEIRHVRFAVNWFKRFTGTADFETWRDRLPAPLSPLLMRGDTMQRARRQQAGFSGDFLQQLASSS